MIIKKIKKRNSQRLIILSVLQIAAMQAGLLKVVPQAVLDLLTWQEVEKKVCGDPEISVEALKRLSECPSGFYSMGAVMSF